MTTDASKVILAAGTRTLAAPDNPGAEITEARSVGLVSFYLDVTAHGGTTPTLDVDIEGYNPTSDSWFIIGSFAQVTETDGLTRIAPFELPHTRIRANWAITGTGATYTFSVGMVAKDY